MSFTSAEYDPTQLQREVVTKVGQSDISVPASADVQYAGGEFGRDSISVAEGNLLFDPDIARRIILARAADQGVAWNYPDETHPSTEEQPGRIIHEKRNPTNDLSFLRSHFSSQEAFDEFNVKNRARTDMLIKQWGEIYYGSVDATPKYITLIRDYVQISQDATILNEKYIDKAGSEKTILESLIAAADWVYNNAYYGPNVNIYDGQTTHQKVAYPLLRFKRLNGLGIENQVMMDSRESFIFPDGTEANHDSPIADSGVQGKAYDALLFAADLLDQRATTDAEKEKANNYRKLAANIQTNTLKLWQNDQHYFAMGEDISGPIPTTCANAAELMNSSIFDNLPPLLREKYITGIVAELFSEGMYTVVGPRMKDLAHRNALAVDMKGEKIIFDAYHDDTAVWIEMNHEIVRGLQRQGLHLLAKQVMLATINGVAIEGKPTEFFRVTTDGKVLYNQKQHLTDDEHADFHVTSLAEEEQTWSNSAVIEFMTLLSAKGDTKRRARRFLKSPQEHWQDALEHLVIKSLHARNLYVTRRLKPREILQARQNALADNLTINVTLGQELQRKIHENWDLQNQERRDRF